MNSKTETPSARAIRRTGVLILAAGCLVVPGIARTQGLTGALIGTVHDQEGGVLPGAVVYVRSPSLIGGAATMTTNERGQLRFPALPPGKYVLEIELPGFAAYHEGDIAIGSGATIERNARLKLAGVAASVVVQGAGSHVDARNPGFGTRFGPGDITAIPTRRASMYDLIRAAPGMSATSPSSGTATTVSAFGSGTNENQFYIDGTNTTCPCNGTARSEPGIGFIQEVQVQSVGASAEFGNAQGAMVNVVTRQGSERFLYDVSYHGQTARLTSQPVTLPYLGSAGRESGYGRAEYRDLTTNFGGPAIRERLWFFTGYQHVRDHDSQPGTDPEFPRRYEQQKLFAKLTWRLAPGWQLVQSFHDEIGASPDRPTIVTAHNATTRPQISVPAITFGNLTHTVSASTVWDVRVGRFVYSREDLSTAGDIEMPSRFDRLTGVTTGGPPRIGSVTIRRTTAKATLTHYRPGFLGDHQWKFGGQFERGDHDSIGIVPSGHRFEDTGGRPLQQVSILPSNIGGRSTTFSAFGTDAITLGDRLTLNAGVRFDHARAISQDLHAIDQEGKATAEIIRGLGTMYTWNVWSPRLGAATKLTADGRTMLRASYGRFVQGVLTGELEPFHPGARPVTTVAFSSATGQYTGASVTVDPKLNLQFDRDTRAPHTNEVSIGIDHAVGRHLSVAVAYVHKNGSDFTGWVDAGGQYVEDVRTLADGRVLPVRRLDTAVTPPSARRFLLTNPPGYSMAYNGAVMAIERRRSGRWQAFGSYTLSRAYGLLPSSGTSAAGSQTSTVSPPQPLLFGRDPNDLTNARGVLPNDRPHMFKMMGSVDLPRTGLVVAGSLQHVSGKPWAAAAQVALPQESRRVLLEPRGSRRLSSQTLLDLRLSRPVAFSRFGRVELLLDVLNVLNDAAEESLASETLTTETAINVTNFGQPASFVDPRRAMFGVRLNLGR